MLYSRQITNALTITNVYFLDFFFYGSKSYIPYVFRRNSNKKSYWIDFFFAFLIVVYVPDSSELRASGKVAHLWYRSIWHPLILLNVKYSRYRMRLRKWICNDLKCDLLLANWLVFNFFFCLLHCVELIFFTFIEPNWVSVFDDNRLLSLSVFF